MSWLDIVSNNAASLIVAGSTIVVTALTLRSNDKRETARLAQEERTKATELAHAQEMRFLEERIRIANQLIEQVSYGMTFLTRKNQSFVACKLFPGLGNKELITVEEIEEATNCRVTARALTTQLGATELESLMDEWNTVMWTFLNVVIEVKGTQEGVDIFDAAFNNAWQGSYRFLNGISKMTGIALPPRPS